MYLKIKSSIVGLKTASFKEGEIVQWWNGDECLTGSNVDFPGLDLSKGVLGQAAVGLCVDLLAVVFSSKGWKNQVAI